MKILPAACLLALTPVLALAQTPSDPTMKPAPFLPIVASEHSGPGRIGVRLIFDKASGLPHIAALTRGGPAADFGFRVGDVIIRIDKNLTTSLSQDEVSLALHGRPGTGVELTVQREDNPKFIVCAIERRVLAPDAEDMVNPPMGEVAKLD